MTKEMTDDELIGYCEIHATTERALFHGSHINRMLALAGHPTGYPTSVEENQFRSLHEAMTELCRLARERQKAPQVPKPPPELPEGWKWVAPTGATVTDIRDARAYKRKG